LLTASQEIIKVVTPAPGFRRDRVAGVQSGFSVLDSGFRRNDETLSREASCESILLF
jgi:hypothetical protein